MEVIPRIRTPRPKTARDFYQRYLQSENWRQRRNRALRLAKWRCQRCQSKRDLEVHHRTYERLGAELDTDLEVLCECCHEGHHIDLDTRSHLGVYIKLVLDAIRKGTFTTTTDLSDMVKTECARLNLPYQHHQVDRAMEILQNRLPFQKLSKARPLSIAPVNDNSPLSRTVAAELLRQIGIRVGLRSMPKAHTPMPFTADRARAAQMVAAEIVASIERCEAIEAKALTP